MRSETIRLTWSGPTPPISRVVASLNRSVAVRAIYLLLLYTVANTLPLLRLVAEWLVGTSLRREILWPPDLESDDAHHPTSHLQRAIFVPLLSCPFSPQRKRST